MGTDGGTIGYGGNPQDRPSIDDDDATLARKFQARLSDRKLWDKEMADQIEADLKTPEPHWTGRYPSEWHQKVFAWINEQVAKGMKKDEAYKDAFDKFELLAKHGVNSYRSLKTVYLRYQASYWSEVFFARVGSHQWSDAVAAFRRLSSSHQRRLIDELF
jgi:ribulose kinase